jgi:DNA (cytosine-5)-methyltransferase 1
VNQRAKTLNAQCSDNFGVCEVIKNFLVSDLFCGAGGSSTGAERAIKELGHKMTLVCINHWPVAIETHKRNHPEARHYIEDITVVDPVKLVPEGYLDLLMASPECTHFSRARGGKPVNNQSRMNPWAILNWLTKLDVRTMLIENVPEFRSWGPVDVYGHPLPGMKGIFFDAWIKAIKGLGYHLDYTLLNAADYGDATTRSRFFLIARKDRKKIRWPEPTHAAKETDKLEKWRAAREIIEWNNPGRSLLDDPRYKKRPLSEKTRLRIAKGFKKFGGALAPLYIQLLGIDGSENGGSAIPKSFVMGKQGNPAYRSINDPLMTLTTEAAPALIEPIAEPFVLGQHSCSAPRETEKPIPTIMTDGAISLIEPVLTKYYGNGDNCESVEDPLSTVTTKDRFGLANGTAKPFILQNRIRPDGDRVYDIDRPLNAITTSHTPALVEPFIVEINHGGGNGRPCLLDKPLRTLTSRQGDALVEPMIVQTDQTGGNGICVRLISKPIPTLVTKNNMAIVEPVAAPAGDTAIDPRRLVYINGELYYLDIRFRMLANIELARAMGFTDSESTYEFVGNKSEVTKQIGNAVPVNLAKALVKVILE